MYEFNSWTNQIFSYGIDPNTGHVIPFGTSIGSGGVNPMSMLLSADGRHLYVANELAGPISTSSPLTLNDYLGSVATFAVDA
jgi:6-phosphogluconolactonase (cycloisomerase 2 family)